MQEESLPFFQTTHCRVDKGAMAALNFGWKRYYPFQSSSIGNIVSFFVTESQNNKRKIRLSQNFFDTIIKDYCVLFRF
jgi:hypothetical protein